ncbi:MAG: lysophospholipid acyltransferase family protein [Nitrospinales bacterium]
MLDTAQTVGRRILDSILSVYHTLRFWTVIILLSIVLGTLSTLARGVDATGGASRNISRLWSRWLCRLNGVRVEIKGLEHVRSEPAQIFVANHQGFFDIFALSGYLPVQLCWVAKSSLFWIPFVGWAMKAAGDIGVNRKDKKKAYQAFLATAEKIKSGHSVVIFPEGTRSPDGSIGEFKKGGHLLAMRTKAPMVPITIIGSGRILTKRSVRVRPHPIQIIISPPLAVENLPPREQKNILEKIREIICENFKANTP